MIDAASPLWVLVSSMSGLPDDSIVHKHYLYHFEQIPKRDATEDAKMEKNVLAFYERRLCVKCLTVMPGSYAEATRSTSRWPLHKSHQRTLKELKDAADLGCPICCALWEKLSKQCQPAVLARAVSSGSDYEHRPWGAHTVCSTSLDLFALEGHAHVWINIDARELPNNGLWPRRYGFRLFPDNKTLPVCSTYSTSSTQALGVAQRWLSDCRSTHKACKRTNLDDWYPTRLLDLGTAGSHRVIETSCTTPTGDYMTLSHRWSRQPSLLLSRHTKDELYKEFDTTRLPLAIRDASMVCIRLGVRYLWVDTLCIIQDDEDLEDWKRESTLMEKVYEGSLLNLFALAASDTEHSLFWKRDPRDVNPVAINDYMIYEMDEDFWRNCVDERPLNLRAWVKQERLLATRNLHFGQEQLLWECAELQAAEAFPSGLPKWVKVPGPPLRHFLKAEPTRGTSSLDVDVYDAWDHLVCEYSKCKVTKGSDKLIAISGLAKRLSKVVKDEYVVGMWRRDLSHGILWYCSEEMDEKKYPGPRRPSEYRAPTFSWASMDAKISMVFFRAYNTKTYIKILDYQLNFVTTDATGLCRGGHLILQCRLQRLIFRHRRKRGGWMSPYKVDLIRPTGTLRSIPRPYLDELTSFFSPVARYDLYAILWTGLEYDLGDTCFPGYYLFLQAVHKEPGTFRRIGLGKTYRDPDVGGYRGMEAGHYPCLSYKDGWHTIRVI